MDDVGAILLLVSAAMGGVVVVLAALYAYVYYTQLRIIRRRTGKAHVDGQIRRPPISQVKEWSKESGGGDDKGDRRIFHPFMILAYASRIKRSNVPADV